MEMHNPPHPGEIIRERCLDALNLSVTDAAKGLGVTCKIFVGHFELPCRNISGNVSPFVKGLLAALLNIGYACKTRTICGNCAKRQNPCGLKIIHPALPVPMPDLFWQIPDLIYSLMKNFNQRPCLRPASWLFACAGKGVGAAQDAFGNPDIHQFAAAQFRAQRRYMFAGHRSAAPKTRALHRRRFHCCRQFPGCLGYPPLLMDFQAKRDDDHVVAIFRRKGCWGAISKSNHLWLRWRDPVYRSLRELAMSYFRDYAGNNRRNLWAYSVPFDLRRFDSRLWISGKESCWDVASALDISRHFPLITHKQAKNLRPCDQIETEANELTEHKKPRNMRKNKAKRKKLR